MASDPYPTQRPDRAHTHTRKYGSCCISRAAELCYGKCPTIDLACRVCVSEATVAPAGRAHGMAVLDVRGTMAREAADEMFPEDMHICVQCHCACY